MRSQDPLIGILILGGLSSVIAMEFTPDHAQAVAEIDGLGLLTASSCQVEKPVLAHHIVGCVVTSSSLCAALTNVRT